VFFQSQQRSAETGMVSHMHMQSLHCSVMLIARQETILRVLWVWDDISIAIDEFMDLMGSSMAFGVRKACASDEMTY